MILVICILLLSFGSARVSAVRSAGLALRRILGGIDVQELDKPLNIAPSPSVTFDQYQSNKRRIRRGSDPIHNKC